MSFLQVNNHDRSFLSRWSSHIWKFTFLSNLSSWYERIASNNQWALKSTLTYLLPSVSAIGDLPGNGERNYKRFFVRGVIISHIVIIVLYDIRSTINQELRCYNYWCFLMTIFYYFHQCHCTVIFHQRAAEIYFLFIPISGRKTVITPISGKKAQTW